MKGREVAYVNKAEQTFGRNQMPFQAIAFTYSQGSNRLYGIPGHVLHIVRRNP
jgi:hypothetical protein